MEAIALFRQALEARGKFVSGETILTDFVFVTIGTRC